MPAQKWKHACSCTPAILVGVPRCEECGVPGVYDGWHYTMYEAMANYQRRYGVKPVGPHRPMSDQLLAGATSTCSDCTGKGLRDTSNHISFSKCSRCQGLGTLWAKSPEEIGMLLRRILAEYPNAEVSKQIDKVDALAFNLSRAEVVASSPQGNRSSLDDGIHATEDRDFPKTDDGSEEH